MPRTVKNKNSGAFDLPVSSFADIAFLLIIFFILVTAIQTTMGVMTDLPAGQKAQQEDDTTATVKIADGRLFLNDEGVDIVELRSRLADMELRGRDDPDRIVVLEAVGSVRWQVYYDVLAAIANADGIVAILTEEDGSAGGGQGGPAGR